MTSFTLPALTIAPGQVVRGQGVLAQMGGAIARLGSRPLIVASDGAWTLIQPICRQALADLAIATATYKPDCSEAALAELQEAVQQHQADVIIGVGGGKALDAAKLLAYQSRLPVVTAPTSAATCAAWTALSNVYSDKGAFLYDVSLARCPDLLILDYALIATAPRRMLAAGIGDAIAKWYEASVSSGASEQTLIIAAVQQARVLRDILFQKAQTALEEPGGSAWREVVDASVLLAGVIGGLGGAQCRTVAAHAVHNGLTHLLASHGSLHGEKVAFGILVQLRLEEMGLGNQLAAAARQQLLQFYGQIGLPKTLEDLGLGEISLISLRQAAEIACQTGSDIHRLPFSVTSEQLMAAMVSTTAPMGVPRPSPASFPKTEETNSSVEEVQP